MSVLTASSEALTIRLASLDDAESIADLLAQLGYPATPASTRIRLNAIGASNGGEAIFAEFQGLVAGVASYHIVPRLADDRPYCRITTLVVAERHRRLGVGSNLVAWIEKRAQATGCDVIEVTSGRRPEREAAHRLYLHRGFEDSGQDSTRYLKRLRASVPDDQKSRK